jgi:anaerobic magnesium-protoporphyrin IX monomethyl ester cyclase
MKILFAYHGQECLALEYLSAVLRKHGHETKLIFDPGLFSDPELDNAWLANRFQYVPFLLEEAEEFRPDVIGICVLTCLVPWATELARKLKRITNAPVVVGGVHVSGAPDSTMAIPEFDYGVVGEGEYPLLRLLEALQGACDIASVPNLMHRRDGRVIKNSLGPFPDLKALPWPDKELFYRESSHFRHGYTLQASRGCPMQCSFCSEHFLSGLSDTGQRNPKAYLRIRAVDDVIGELVEQKTRYAFTHVRFQDDILGFDRAWFREFAPAYRKQVGVPYWCYMYPSLIDEQMVELLIESGCYEVQIGVQSLTRIRKDVMHRYETDDQVIRAIELFRGTPIVLTADNIIGVPGQQLEEVLHMARFYSAHRPDQLHAFWFTNFPGTSILSIAEEQGYLTDSSLKEIERKAEHGNFYGDTPNYDPLLVKARCFLLFVPFLPERLTAFILRTGLYRYWPSSRYIFIPARLIQYFATKRLAAWHTEGRLVYKTINYVARILKRRAGSLFGGGRRRRWRALPEPTTLGAETAAVTPAALPPP